MLKTTDKGTFFIQILDQQHSSWQGSVTWLATKEKVHFRSAFELLKLIDSALSDDEDQTRVLQHA